MMYYIMYNGQQMGPMPADQLRNYGLNPQSMVWAEGMPNWVPASAVPELAPMLGAQPQTPYGQNLRQPGYGATMPLGNRGMQMTAQVDNHLTLAIISTVVSFLFSCIGVIFGIIAIVKANKVNTYLAAGQQDLAVDASKSAKTFSIVALVLAALGFVGSLAMFWDAL